MFAALPIFLVSNDNQYSCSSLREFGMGGGNVHTLVKYTENSGNIYYRYH